MPKNKNKNIGTSSLKVKPQKRPGLIKQLSQPFLPSSKKNKNGGSPEPVQLISARRKDELGLYGGYDDMFLLDKNGYVDTVFMSPEKEIETFLKFEQTPLTLDIPHFEKCSSRDSGYTSPPCQSDLLSPTSGTPGKGILKKMRSVSPCDNRSESPIFAVINVENYGGPTVTYTNGVVNESLKNRAMSPVERCVSPLAFEDFENALGFLDDVIDQESDRKLGKKSVSFGELAEVKKYLSDSSDNDICDDFKPFKKNVSFGDVEDIKRKKDTINECNKSIIKKCVSFEDVSKSELEVASRNSVSCEDLLSSTDTENSMLSEIKKCLEEKCDMDNDTMSCECEAVCQFEVEVKVIDIQPLFKVGDSQGEGQINYDVKVTNTEMDRFNITICHHPGCTKHNENRPMLLCKECDHSIHQRQEYNGHLVLDLPKRKQHENGNKFQHANSTPALGNQFSQSVTSMDIEEEDLRDEGIDEGDGPPDFAPMDMPYTVTPHKSTESPEMGEIEKRLKRKKVVKAKRRHTTGVRSHSASDIFSDELTGGASDDDGTVHRYSYHGSIDEHTLGPDGRRTNSNNALHQVGKGAINHETFTVKIRGGPAVDEEIEIVAAEKNITLREAIQPIMERRGMDIQGLNIFVEASKTPLPLNCETFLLGGTTMFIKQKDGDPPLPICTQSLSKATGSKYTAAKTPSSKSSKSGMSRRDSMISRAQSMLEAPISKQRRSSLQLPFQAFFPNPKAGDDETSGSLRSRRGINMSIDDNSLPMSLTASISPQGTLREITDNRKQKNTSKLTTLFSPLNKDKEKQDQLNELLNSYSVTGLPQPPSLVQIGHPQIDQSVFSIEQDWRAIVESAASLTKRQQDQQEAIWELLQTELYYIRSLRVISDLFLCVLLNLQNEVLLNDIDTERLFNNISDIEYANGEFWTCHLVKVLEEARSSAAPLNPSIMLEGFKKYHDLFQPYIQYCCRQKPCTDYMKAQYADNELFKTFVIWAEAQKQCNRLKLTDLLVKPMQRLTKYSLLLQAILGKTDDELQRRDLLEMIGCVDKFVYYVNGTLRQQHEEEKLQAIVDKIEPYDAVEAPNDECLKLIQPYNSNFNLTAPMPGCDTTQTRSLVMQSPLKLKEYQNRMDVECLLFTDLLLICKASKRMDKYKIVKPPMRVDRIIIHELKDKGCFLLIYVNEYHIPVSSFTFHADQNAIHIWLSHIRKAQELYKEARLAAETILDKLPYVQSEIISEEVIGYTPLMYSDTPPLLHLTRCSSQEPESQNTGEENSQINRSRSWNEMVSMGNEPGHHGNTHQQVPKLGSDSQIRNSSNSSSEPQLEQMSSSADFSSNHQAVQYSRSDPTVFTQYLGEDRLSVPSMSLSRDRGNNGNDTSLPEFVDESMKSKLHQSRRQSRTEKRYYTADAIQELNKTQNRDNAIYKRLSWNFPNGDLQSDKQGVLKTKTMSSDSLRSFHSSSGVSSTGSLHLSPEGDICEESELYQDDMDDIQMNNKYRITGVQPDINEDDISEDIYMESEKSKSKSTSDIVSLMQDLHTHESMKDGITSVILPNVEEQSQKLSHTQLMRMKKQLLLSSNIEASEV